MPQAKLTVQSAAQTFALYVQAQALIGLKGSKIHLLSPDGKIDITVPTELFPSVKLQPGEQAVVTLGLTRVAVEEEPDPVEGASLLKGGH